MSFAQVPGGKNFHFKAEQLSFNYISYEEIQGSPQQVKCTHAIENELSQDWVVTCGSKHYSVHLWLSEYHKAQIPKASFELLYWVSDRSVARETKDTGTTLWFNFKEPSDLHSISAKQGVDNDTAGLYLDISL